VRKGRPEVTQKVVEVRDRTRLAITGYAMHYNRSHDAVINVYDDAGNVIETHEHAGEFKEW
jgi:hypothetical protein